MIEEPRALFARGQVTFCLCITIGLGSCMSVQAYTRQAQATRLTSSQRFQIFLHEREGNGTFTDSGGYPMIGTIAHITGREDTGYAGF